MGGCRCSFRNCENSTSNKPGMHFFHYPIRDKERLIKWVEIAEKQEYLTLEVDKLKNKVVCEIHFEERCFMNIKHERLIQAAVPTIIGANGTTNIVDISADDISQYEILSIEPLPNENVVPPTNNEPVLLNNRKRPNATKDNKTRSDNFVVDLNLEGLQNGDLTISFEESQTKSPSTQPPAKQRRTLFYPPIIKTRKENRILNSSLNLNAKLSESLVLNNVSGTLEPPKKSSISKFKVKAEKETPVVQDPIPSVENLQQNVLSCDLVDSISSVSPNQHQTPDLSAITDAVHKTVESFNILDTNTFKTKNIEQTNQMIDLKKILTSIKLKQDEISKDVKTNQESLNQISINQAVQFNVLAAKQVELATPSVVTTPSTKAESTTSTIKSKFNQNKIQLFNGIKKYLNPAMVALLRMELFGSSEREWKSDEKSISVELLNLGSPTYDYIRDEWRFRLPPKKDVEKWTNDNLDDEEENSDVN